MYYVVQTALILAFAFYEKEAKNMFPRNHFALICRKFPVDPTFCETLDFGLVTIRVIAVPNARKR
jgi:hypothetical protein